MRGVSFNVLPGEQLTLLGPSGCGKTTTLRAIAGLEQPTAGEIRIDGAVVYSSEQGVNVRAEKRGLSMVFQSYAIWPHMTVFENVAYGLRVRRTGAAEIAEKVDQALDMVQMRGFASRRAAQLSGGADVAKAEQEGQLVFYCHENEAGTAGIMEGFRKDFPKIKTSYVRAQTGALYNKILSERSAGRFDVDVIQLSDIAPAFDFQKKGGYEHYVSPERAPTSRTI